MSEQIRDIEVIVNVDTNKRTFTNVIRAESLDDALEQVRDHLADIRWSL